MARIVASAVKLALDQHKAESDRLSALHTQAAVAAALANQSNQVRALKKPDLPPVDKRHIEQWIERIEFAYTRAEVTRPKDKLAFLETKFAGCEDPQLNELLRGTTDSDWQRFLDHLRDIYGRTTQDKVNSLLGGFPREGRRPQQLASHIRDRIGNISLDDILKEVLLKEIPAAVRQHAATATKDLDFQKTADHLEIYFDKQGKVLNSSGSSTSVNAVGQQQQRPRQLQSAMKQDSFSRASSGPSSPSSESSSFTNAFSDDEGASDVNAVRFKANGQRQSFNVDNSSQSRSRPRQNNSNPNNNTSQSFSRRGRSTSRYGNSSSNGRTSYSSSSSNNNNNPSRDPSSNRNGNKVCSFHIQYGEKAISCRENCMMWSKHQAKGQASN